MICIEQVNKYCKDIPILIENYEQAINDETQTWHCHHRLETDENKTGQQLIAEGRYYNVPASELIFLTPSEHTSLHAKLKDNINFTFKDRKHTEYSRQLISDKHSGDKNPMYGHSIKEFMTEEEYNEWKKNHQGENNGMFGKNHTEETKKKQSDRRKQYLKNRTEIHITNGIISKRIDISEFEYYKTLGFTRGRKILTQTYD